ncbi:MAG: hypothetical protein II205_01805, partial [Bacteroidales bacterium]|nr:hypothetical protein [Bacteroidales bacterium]
MKKQYCLNRVSELESKIKDTQLRIEILSEGKDKVEQLKTVELEKHNAVVKALADKDIAEVEYNKQN